MKKTFWVDIHRELGCDGCEFCDYDAYGNDACCTYPGRIKTEDETGKCLTREDEYKTEEDEEGNVLYAGYDRR